ncbi:MULTISPECIES: CGP-CTERM sorting domain-containing protein [Thermococcus]|uniref:Amylopullulanase, GH57 family n=2 Tax=Thermococcus sibiricus TaxID=172049 RepID=C6A0Z5_THESM|nr:MULTISPECIES: CGP-CTERM sorting domain-containing protein [Thermococcus]KUK28248.1 MAG: Amylopullulanase, GH57 family [Thermococcus sp. 40_45]HII67091.1 CGP-CTERM sorting domain-containing protein [Thermococcaceae archaeon]ACS89290.1 amylopullulanase, GH57 family [Thermococcus sibiricus MM 739]KUK17369.1 MAG: Amylopullulanase, GH57 family [Thermococcus sibiricus]MBC7095190.1 CGP-CTERM sorting domain-containing protein [Thermococcus sp.]
MKKLSILISVFVLFGLFGAAFASATTVAVDLGHGENEKYLAEDVLEYGTNKTLAHGIVKTITNVQWGYFGDPLAADILGITHLGEKITSDALANVDMLILGQPTSPFQPDEIQAIVNWFNQGGKVLWIAGDSDYGSSGVNAIDIVNSVLEQLGSELRLDQCQIQDPVSNAGQPYRVIGLVQPDDETPDKEMITNGFKYGGKVLYHGPGVVAWVNENGEWQPLIDGNVPENVYRIVKTSPDAQISEANEPPANAYMAGDTGVFTFLAAKIIKFDNGKQSVLIVSAESPYGDYEPTWSPKYYGIDLDGPTFVTNMINWALKQVSKETITVTVTETITKTETKTETVTETKTETTTETVQGGICGPAALIGLALIPLLLKRKK